MLDHFILFPVLTTAFSLPPTEDAYVNESSPTSTNNGTTMIGRFHGSGYGRHGYVKIDLTTLSMVNEGLLELYGSAPVDTQVGIYPALSTSFDETTLTFDNSPSWDAGPISVVTVGSTAQYYTWDISEYIYQNAGSIIGLVVRPLPHNQETATFDTKEGTNPPRLVGSVGSGLAAPSGKPIIPSAQGYGVSWQMKGRSPVKMTSIGSSGAGTIVDLLAESNQIIVPEISGTVALAQLEVSSTHYAICGQTAPHPGLVLKNAFAPVHGANILIQHVSFVNEDAAIQDSFRIGELPSTLTDPRVSNQSTKLVFDHVWFTGGVDECFDIWGNLNGQFHFKDCIFGPGAIKKYGVLLGGPLEVGSNFDVSFDKCLFIHNDERNPLAKCRTATLNNCIIYNWGTHGTYVSSREVTNLCNANIVGCKFISGPSKANINPPIYLDNNSWEAGSQVWVSGCDWVGTDAPGTITNQWDDLVKTNGVTGAQAVGPINWPSGMTTIDVSVLEAYIIANVGPRPGNRIPEIQALIDNMINRDGSHLAGNPPAAPALASNTVSHGTLPDNTVVLPSGYTALEEWLHIQSDIVETS